MDKRVLSILREAGKDSVRLARKKKKNPRERKLLLALGAAFLAVCAAESLLALARAERAAR